MKRLMLLLLFLFPSSVLSKDLKLPEVVKGVPGSFAVVRAETDGKIVRWLLLDEGASLLPPELMKDTMAAVVFTPKAGRFRLLAYTARGDEPSAPVICVIEVADPKPPTPPTPPQPTDPLSVKLQAAYTADVADVATKAKQLAILYGLYSAMSEHCQTDDTLKTLGDVLTQLHQTARDMKLMTEHLIECRKAIAVEVATLGASPSVPFDPTLRAAAVRCFARIAKALEGVK